MRTFSLISRNFPKLIKINIKHSVFYQDEIGFIFIDHLTVFAYKSIWLNVLHSDVWDTIHAIAENIGSKMTPHIIQMAVMSSCNITSLRLNVAAIFLSIQINFLLGMHALNHDHNIEPHREKTGFLPMRKQRRRSASQ